MLIKKQRKIKEQEENMVQEKNMSKLKYIIILQYKYYCAQKSKPFSDDLKMNKQQIDIYELVIEYKYIIFRCLKLGGYSFVHKNNKWNELMTIISLNNIDPNRLDEKYKSSCLDIESLYLFYILIMLFNKYNLINKLK